MLEDIKIYLSGVTFQEGHPIALVKFPIDWEIRENSLFEVVKDTKSNDSYYVTSRSDSSIEFLVDYLKSVIAYNLDLEKRVEWYNGKVSQLKNLIEMYSAEELEDYVIHNVREIGIPKAVEPTQSFRRIIDEVPTGVVKNTPQSEMYPAEDLKYVIEKEPDFDEDYLQNTEKPTYKYDPETGDFT